MKSTTALLSGSIFLLALLPSALATSPSIPLEDAVRVQWPTDPTPGNQDEIRVRVTPDEDLVGQLNITLDLPAQLTSQTALRWTPIIEAGKTVEKVWIVHVESAGLWSATVTSETTYDPDSGPYLMQRLQAYGLSSRTVQSAVTTGYPEDVVPHGLLADSVSVGTDRNVTITFTPSDWMLDGWFELAQAPVDPWTHSFATRIDQDTSDSSTAAGPNRVTVQTTVTDDPGPKLIRLAWRTPDGGLEVTAACWKVRPNADSPTADPCPEGVLNLPAPGPLLVGALVAVVAMIARPRRP